MPTTRPSPTRTRTTALVAAVLGGLVLLTGACGQTAPQVQVSSPADPPDGITVTGDGETRGAPDTLAVTLGVSVKRESVDAAIGDATGAATALLDTLKGAGVAEEDLQTAAYSITPEFRSEGERVLPDGFRVSNTVVARIRELDGAGEVLDAATRAAGDVAVLQDVTFLLEEDSAANRAARADAFRDARAKAEQYAELAGRELGDVESVIQVASPVTDEQTLSATAFDESRQGAPTPIQAGQLETTVRVDVRFALR